MDFNWDDSILTIDGYYVTCEKVGDRVKVNFTHRCPEYKYFERVVFFWEICPDGRVIPTNMDWTRRHGNVKEAFKELSSDPTTQYSYGIAIRHLIILQGYSELYGNILLDNLR